MPPGLIASTVVGTVAPPLLCLLSELPELGLEEVKV